MQTIEAREERKFHEQNVIVFGSTMVSAWPKPAPLAEVISFNDAMTREFKTDAHFVPYETSLARRLSAESLERGASATLHFFVIDVDDSEAHANGSPASDTWRADFATRCRDLHAWGYSTKGGARLVWALEHPFVIANEADSFAWQKAYKARLLWLFKHTGIIADVACCDWGRLYRAPHATREGSTESEKRGWVCGAPYALNVWRDQDHALSVEEEVSTRLKIMSRSNSKRWASDIAEATPKRTTQANTYRAKRPKGDLSVWAHTEITNAPKGHRNNTIFKTAWFLSERSRSGEITRAEAQNAIILAAQSVGLKNAEIQQILKSAKL